MGDSADSSNVVRQARGGDPKALQTLYEAHADAVYAVAFRITDSPHDAQDVRQDVFVALPNALASYEGRGTFDRWLRQIAARTALMRVRAARLRREVRLASTPQFRTAGNPLDSLELRGAISQLPETLRDVFILREVEGFTHSEIGDLLGISRGASEVRLFRARARLRSALLSVFRC